MSLSHYFRPTAHVCRWLVGKNYTDFYRFPSPSPLEPTGLLSAFSSIAGSCLIDFLTYFWTTWKCPYEQDSSWWSPAVNMSWSYTAESIHRRLKIVLDTWKIWFRPRPASHSMQFVGIATKRSQKLTSINSHWILLSIDDFECNYAKPAQYAP